MRRLIAVAMLAGPTLAGCVAPTAPAASVAIPVPQAYGPGGLEAVMGATATALTAQFGTPDLDAREGPARKLQFLGPACVLDAYLYPPRSGRGEPTVTHVDARQPDGREMDRSSCVAALTRRREAR